MLLKESVDLLAQAGPGLYLDGTLGAGGHADALLDAVEGSRVLGLDRDPAALALAAERLGRHGDRVFFCPPTSRSWERSRRGRPRRGCAACSWTWA